MAFLASHPAVRSNQSEPSAVVFEALQVAHSPTVFRVTLLTTSSKPGCVWIAMTIGTAGVLHTGIAHETEVGRVSVILDSA